MVTEELKHPNFFLPGAKEAAESSTLVPLNLRPKESYLGTYQESSP